MHSSGNHALRAAASPKQKPTQVPLRTSPKRGSLCDPKTPTTPLGLHSYSQTANASVVCVVVISLRSDLETSTGPTVVQRPSPYSSHSTAATALCAHALRHPHYTPTFTSIRADVMHVAKQGRLCVSECSMSGRTRNTHIHTHQTCGVADVTP